MKPTIFLIEDSTDIMEVYKMALEAAGITVVGLASGKEAMEKIKKVRAGMEERPGLVLLDLVLPDINGLEILRELREHKTTKDIAVFILSNYTSDALLNIKYIKPDKFLLKSDVSPTQLTDLVLAQLNMKK